MKHKILSLQICIVLTIVGMFGISGKISAQEVNSLYFLDNTPMHTQWNPAMAPKHSSVGIGLSNVSLGFQSDLAFSDLFTPSSDGKTLYTFLSPNVDKNDFISKLKDVSSINFNSSMDFINIGFRLLNNYFTFHSGLNVDFGGGIPKDFFKMFMLGMDKNTTSTNFDLTKTKVNAMAYAKIGVGYSMNIGSKLSVGINANYLYGIADMRMGFDQLTVNASQTNWTVTTKGYLQMAAPEQISFEYKDDGYLDKIQKTGNFTSLPHAGSGMSIDLGATFKPLSILKLSASITDIGSIKWNKDCVQRAKSSGTFAFNGVDLNDENEQSTTSKDVIQNFRDMAHFQKDNTFSTYSSSLTTKMNLGGEVGFLNDRISAGLLSQTCFASDGTYENIMISANAKPISIIQAALTYSLLHGKQSAIGAAVNAKLLFFDLFFAADCIPTKFSPQMIPINNSYFNTEFGLNVMF